MKWLPTLNYQGKQRKCRETRVPGSNHQILRREFNAGLMTPAPLEAVISVVVGHLERARQFYRE